MKGKIIQPKLIALAISLLLFVVILNAFPLIIKLKNDTIIQGEITSFDAEGFEFKRWDTGGIIRFQWNQLPEEEVHRLKIILKIESTSQKELDGFRVYAGTSTVFEGIKTMETEEQLVFKNISGTRKFFKKEILKIEPIKISLFEIYQPEEIYQQRLEKIKADSADDNYQLGKFCVDVLKLYSKAREHLLKAAEIDPVYQERVDKKLSDMEKSSLMEKVSQVEDKLSKKDIEAARQLLQMIKQEFDLADEEVKQVVQALEKEILTLESQLMKEATKKIITDWHKDFKRRLRKIAANPKISYNDARQYVLTILPGEIIAKLAEDYQLKESEVEQIWQERDLKTAPVESASYGDGSWLIPIPSKPPTDINEFAKYKERMRRINKAKRKAQQEKKFITADAWWAKVSSHKKENWLEAFFAERHLKVKEVKIKPCSTCGGEGVLKDGLCPRCFGTMYDVTIVYQ